MNYVWEELFETADSRLRETYSKEAGGIEKHRHASDVVAAHILSHVREQARIHKEQKSACVEGSICDTLRKVAPSWDTSALQVLSLKVMILATYFNDFNKNIHPKAITVEEWKKVEARSNGNEFDCTCMRALVFSLRLWGAEEGTMDEAHQRALKLLFVK